MQAPHASKFMGRAQTAHTLVIAKQFTDWLDEQDRAAAATAEIESAQAEERNCDARPAYCPEHYRAQIIGPWSGPLDTERMDKIRHTHQGEPCATCGHRSTQP